MPEDYRTRISDEVVEGYKQDFVTVGRIGHIISTGFMDPGIRPNIPDAKIVGRAFTVHMPSTDMLANRIAVDTASPGDVLVIDCGRDIRSARFGAMICFDAQVKGIPGMIIDGAITGSTEIRKHNYPVWCRGNAPKTGGHSGPPGSILVDVQCGEVYVRPGDLIVADNDGVVVIPTAEAPGLLEKCRKRYGTGRTDGALLWILSGRPYSQYPGAGWESRDDLPAPTRKPATKEDLVKWGMPDAELPKK
jgi:regulator of RNase E activity RraA